MAGKSAGKPCEPCQGALSCPINFTFRRDKVTRFMRRYYGNYPREQLTLLRQTLARAAAISAIFILPAVLGAGSAIYNLIDGGSAWLIPQAILCLCVMLFVGYGIIDEIRHMNESRLFVFYKSEVGGATTLLAGSAVSRNMKLLDELADRLHVTSIYDFGFEVYPATKGVRWHNAGVMAQSIGALLSYLRTHSQEMADSAAIIEDLEKMESALKLAESKGIEACFHFTNSRAYSGAFQRSLLPHSHF
jgi:hypothetical protein